MSELIKQFHNLKGISIGERKKNLHELLKNPALKDQQDEFIKNLQPKTFLEELFKLEIQIFLRRTLDLLQILKDGNDVFVSKIIKKQWFFKDAITNVSLDDFVNKYLPNMSYTARMKVLKRTCIVLPEEQVDLLFVALLNRYGLFIAKQFLPFCSVSKIRAILIKHDIELLGNQLKLLLKKDKNLIHLYIKQLETQGKRFGDNHFMKYIAKKDVDLFLELNEIYHVKIKLGRRTSKKIIELRRADVLENSADYMEILKESVIFRKLKDDFKEFYFNIFPKTEVKKYVNVFGRYRFLKHVPSRLQYSIMSDTYKRIYGENMEDNNIIMKPKILTILFVRDSQACSLLASKLYKNTQDNNFLKCFPVSKALSIIKEKINLTSKSPDRAVFYKLMIEVCAYQNDMEGLEDVLTYFCKRHRNEEKYSRSSFLNYVFSQFAAEKFNEKHWNCLLELIKVQMIKNEKVSEEHIFKYIEFLIRNNKSIEEYLDYYIKLLIEDKCWLRFSGNDYNTDLLRTILLRLVDEVPKQLSAHIEEDRRLIRCILDFNKCNSTKPIDIYSIPRFVDSLKEKDVKKINCNHLNNIENIICSKIRNQIEEEILGCYFSFRKDDADRKILTWFLKHDILVIEKYFDVSAPGLVKTHCFKILKKYSHLNIDKRLILYLKQQLNRDVKYDEKLYLIRPLVLMLSPNEYVSITKQYIPESDRVDLTDDNARDIYNFQCELAKHFKFVIHMPTVFETILNYSKGDYLAHVLCSLYSAFYKVPENQLVSAVDFLSKKSVSVRKHALFLSCNIMPLNFVIKTFKKIGSQEKNISVQKHLFTASIKYFTKNPSTESWDLVKSFISFIDKSDEESMKSLTKCNIAKKYQIMYWQAAWEYFENNTVAITNSYVYMNKLLSKIDEQLLSQLPVELLNDIINKYFLTNSKLGEENNFRSFIILFLLSEKRVDTFNIIFGKISNYKAVNKCSIEDLNIQNIFNAFISHREYSYFTDEILNKFSLNWYSNFTPIEAFKEFVILSVLKLHHSTNKNIALLSVSISKFVDETVQIYGSLILSKLCDFVRGILGKLLNDDEKFPLVENILKHNKNTLNCILILNLLNLIKGKLGKDIILNKIIEVSDPQVQLLCNLLIADR